VFNGDFFDFYSVRRKFYSNGQRVQEQILEIKEANKAVFDELACWIENGNRVVFVLGNHDYPIASSKAREFIKKAIVPARHHAKIHFTDSVLINDNAYVEHGHRFESLYETHPRRLMKYVRTSLRRQLFRILKKYPYIYNNRNYEDNIFFLLLFIDPRLYIQLGTKSILPFILLGISKFLNRKKHRPKKIAPDATEMAVHFPVVSEDFYREEFFQAKFFKKAHKLRLMILSGLIGWLKRNKSGSLRKSEQKMLAMAHARLQANRAIKCYIVGHFHLCFECRIKKTSQTIFGLGTWNNWFPFLRMMNHKNPDMLNYWLNMLTSNKENAFTHSSRQLPYIEIVGSEVRMRDWSKPGIVLGSLAPDNSQRT